MVVKDVAPVRLSGELDACAVPQLRRQLEDALRAGQPLLLDLSGVTFLDAAAVGVLVSAKRDAAEAGLPFAVVTPSRSARRVLELCQLQDLLDDPH